MKISFKKKKKISVCAIVPARSGSRKVKNKNIIKILNHPIFAYSIGIAKKTSQIEKVIFSSDSKFYLKIAKKYKPDFLHKRSKKNSSHTATDFDFIKEISKYLKYKFNYKPDLFVLLRGNCPTRNIDQLNTAIKRFKKNMSNFSALRSVSRMSETSYKTFYIDKKKLRGAFKDRFDIESLNRPKEKFPETFSGNGYLDIIKQSSIEKNFVHGKKVMPFINRDICVDIDYPDDVIYAKYVLTKFKYFKLKS